MPIQPIAQSGLTQNLTPMNANPPMFTGSGAPGVAPGGEGGLGGLSQMLMLKAMLNRSKKPTGKEDLSLPNQNLPGP